MLQDYTVVEDTFFDQVKGKLDHRPIAVAYLFVARFISI